MKKNIGRKNWKYIGKYNPAAKWARPFCIYTLSKTSFGYRRECHLRWVVYLLVFIPFHLLEALCLMWEGGLKDFEIEKRFIGGDNFNEKYINEEAYPKAKEVWERT